MQRIILTRPAVEAGERLGFLPGDLAQKVDPYLRPLYDALYELMGLDRVGKAFEKATLEVAPLAFMRGRTLNHAFVILDEAQNTTPEQMKMFLTRIGFGSKAVVTGDVSQIDLPKGTDSGLVEAERILRRVDGIATTHFTSADVVRHPLVARIVEAYGRADAGAGRRAALSRRPALARAALGLSLQFADAAPSAAAAAPPRRPLAARGAGRAGRADGAHRRRRGRPRPQPRVPRQGLRHQRADLRLPARADGRRRHRALRAGGRARGRRAGHRASRRTTRTCWCTAPCMRRASTTSGRPRRRRWKRARARSSSRLGFADPYAGSTG